MLAKNFHVREDLCWLLKVLQLQYHQPRVLTIPIMSISLKRVFVVHSYHYKSSCVKVNCSKGWWMAMAISVCYIPSLKWVSYGISIWTWVQVYCPILASDGLIFKWAWHYFGLIASPCIQEKNWAWTPKKPKHRLYSALIRIPIIKLYTLTTLHKCQALVLWWRPKAHRFSKMCVPTPKLDHAHC
jgi:hypothetical protein